MYIASIIILAVLVIIFVSVAKVYHSIPLIELKRRARSGQRTAKSLYKVASYQYSSQFLLLLLATIASAFFFVLLAKRSPLWVAVISDLTLIWLAYIWIPRSAINVVSQYLAQLMSRPLGWVLQYLHPVLMHFHKILDRPAHTGLYEREDIVRLLTTQLHQSDNRIEEFEIDLLKHVVSFSSKRVIDIMTPRRKVHAISAHETLGPIVLSELHKVGHSHFPVYEDKPSDVVGILSLPNLTKARSDENVYEAMTQNVYYVHEEQYLSEVLQVMLRSAKELFLVVNSFGDYTGIVTAREVLKSLVGDTVTESFDKYDNRELVAKRFTADVEPDDNDLPEHTTEVVE